MTQVVSELLAAYGPYGFGLVAVASLILLLAAVWVRVVRPDLETRLKISEADVQVTANLRETSASMARATEGAATLSRALSGACDRIERAAERIESQR